jgi:parvulin-like peptidyl-prolyl isomerase
MGFVSMRKNFGHHMRTLMWLILAVFVVGTFFLWGYTGRGGGPQRRSGGAAADAVLAIVNGERIRRSQLEAFIERDYRELDRMGVLSLGRLELFRAAGLERLMQQRLLIAAAKQQGLNVSRRDMNREIAREVEQRAPRGGADREQRRLAEADANRRRDEIRDMLLLQRVQQAVLSEVKAGERDVRDSYRQVRARHILIRVDPSGKNGLPDAQAVQKAEQVLAELKAGGDFAALAKRYSQEQTTAARGGELGFVGRGQTVPEFDKAAFSLKPGQLSEVVKTTLGYHIIKVEEERSNLPSDFAKNKARYREQYMQQQQGRVWQTFVEGLRAHAKTEIVDPEMLGANAMAQGRDDEAIAAFTRARQSGSGLEDQVRAAIRFSLGDLYARKGNWDAAREMYESAAEVAMSSFQDIYLALGRAYRNLSEKAAGDARVQLRDQALKNYLDAENEAPEDSGVRQQLLAEYQKMGDKPGVAREQKWLDEQQRKLAEEQRKRMQEAARAKAAAGGQKAAATKRNAAPEAPAGATSPAGAK